LAKGGDLAKSFVDVVDLSGGSDKALALGFAQIKFRCF
jgi:hypothetical protein